MAQLPPDLIEAREAARHFDINYRTLQAWWKRGAIPFWRRGDGRVLLRRSDLLDKLARRKKIEPGGGK